MKRKALTSKKAKQILTDKTVHGQPLTEKQKKFFGAIAGGQKPYKKRSAEDKLSRGMKGFKK